MAGSLVFTVLLHLSEAPRAVSAAQPVADEREVVRATPSCAAPDAMHAERCRTMEAAILASTVRLRLEELAPAEGGFEVVDHSIGHATVMAGRYLVTHNHFSLSLANLHDGRLRRLSAYGPDGRVIVQHAPLHVFEVLVAEPQTLVLDFGTYGRQGALAYFGFSSAEFIDWRTSGLQPGDEVAQVNWDGQRTFVEWVRVAHRRDQDGAPSLELENYVAQGASGGGIFYEGAHVGNNWFHGSVERAESGDVLRQYTVAALNGANLLALVNGSDAPGVVQPPPVANETLTAADGGASFAQ